MELKLNKCPGHEFDGMKQRYNSQVIHILMGSGKGGIEVLIPRLITNMSAMSMHVYVVRGNARGDECVFRNTSVLVFKGSTSRLGSLTNLFTHARKNRHAIFHGYNLGPLNLLTLRMAGASKVVYSIHGTVYWKTSLQRTFVKLAWKLALIKKPLFISNSYYSARVFKEKIYGKVKISTIYNPIADIYMCERLGSHLKKPNEQLDIVYVGRLVKGKNLKNWLEVAQYISCLNPQIRFSIYGQGPLEEILVKYAEDLGIASKVSFMGFVDDVGSVYQQADLLLFLSEYESFGNVVVESILTGTPVICSDIPSMREIFAEYPEFIVPLDENIKEAVADRIQDLAHLKIIAGRAREEFRARFSMENHVRELQNIYDGFFR